MLAALFFICPSAGRSHRAKTVSVIDQQPEIILLFQGNDLFDLPLVAAHSKYAFGYY